MFERDPLNVQYGNHIDENSEFLDTVSSISVFNVGAFGSAVNPAFINNDIVAQNVAEGGVDALVYSDPLCDTMRGTSGIPFQLGRLREQRGERVGACREDTARFNFLEWEMNRASAAASFDHTFSESAEFYAFGSHMENEVKLQGGGLNNTGGSSATRGPLMFLATPGSTNAAAPVSFFGSQTELGYFAPYIGLDRPTAADMPNHPISAANGGINALSWTSIRDNIPRNGERANFTNTEETLFQAGMRGDFIFNDRDWNYDVSYAWSTTSNEQTYQAFDRRRAELAANGLGGPNCTPNGDPNFDFINAPIFGGAAPNTWAEYATFAYQTFFPGYVFNTRESLALALTSNNHGQDGCMFYNPFLTQFSDPNLANSQELMDWMNLTILRADKRNKLKVWDAVVAGGLFDMAGGEAEVAFGAQYRERNATSNAPEINFPGIPNAILDYENGVPSEFHYVSANMECSNCIFNFDNTRTTEAVFAELSLPFLENVETRFAVRYENYGGFIGSEVSPKAAISWRPVEELLLRASFSQSFRAPNIGIIEEGLEAGSVRFRDPLSAQRVRAGLDEANIANGEWEQTFTLGGPAPNVGNEHADVYSMGFIWTPSGALDGLSVQADAWRFEVDDRVLPESPNLAIQPEVERFKQVVNDPANYILNDSISLDSPMPNTPCDPNALEAEFGRDSDERLNCVVNPLLYLVDGIQRGEASETANLITLTLRAVNSGRIEADGVDVKLGYTWDTDLGRFSVNSDYTHVRQYKLIDVPGTELGLLNTGINDAAGTNGDGALVRSLPDNKGNITFSWLRDQYSANIINRHIGSYQDLRYESTYADGNDLVRSLVRRKLDSYQTWDVQFNYTHDWDNPAFGSTVFTFGVLDLLDEEIPHWEYGDLNYDAVVFDPRGRRIYARFNHSF